MNKHIKNSFGTLMVAGLILLVGCADPQAPRPQPPPPPPKVTFPNHAILTTPGVKIVAKNGDWKMEYMKPVTPPAYYSGDMWKTAWIDENRNAYRTAPFSKYTFDVDVFVEGMRDPLHGKMCFFAVPDGWHIEPSAKRVWTVALPAEFIEIARTGNMAIVYQPTLRDINNPQAPKSTERATWILWLSSVPF